MKTSPYRSYLKLFKVQCQKTLYVAHFGIYWIVLGKTSPLQSFERNVKTKTGALKNGRAKSGREGPLEGLIPVRRLERA